MNTERVPVVGESPSFLSMLEQVSQVAALAKPVLVLGERGTGKELVAARLHYLSPRWQQPFVKLNCAVLTESLLESELFGHEAGAFTGASREHVGRFERADGGTLLLDELGGVPLRMQEKILRVIEYGEFERVGGSQTIRVDVRIIGATNEDLPQLARAGQFRPDLLDRLAFDVINVPPLRARRDDILPLANHFAVQMTSELDREYFPGFSPRAASALLVHDWPGNVRELKNAVERSVYRMSDPRQPLNRIVFDPFDTPYRENLRSPVESAASESPVAQATRYPALPVDLRRVLGEFEVAMIERALQAGRYRQRDSAELLGLTYHQLRAALRRHGLTGRSAQDRRSVRRDREPSPPPSERSPRPPGRRVRR